MSKIVEFTLSYQEELGSYLEKKYSHYPHRRLLRKSMDARGAQKGKIPKIHYKVELSTKPFSPYIFEKKQGPTGEKKLVNIIGAGPAGLFCALELIQRGIPCRLFERGKPAYERMKDIALHWRYGQFNPESNVCFGEGGAGLFSDGKLITRIKSPFIEQVMKTLVFFGAPEEVAFVSNPHLGSNKIRGIIGRISHYLQQNGCEIFYQSKVEKLLFQDNKVCGVKLSSGKEFPSDCTVLAMGHSADELYFHLQEQKVAMRAKDFAVGVRIEHPRPYINKIQYGDFALTDPHKQLGAARYRLTYHHKESDRGSYSFCMCPGGYVLSSGTRADGIVTNGMSNFAQNSPWSNSALVVSVREGEDFHAQQNVLAGLAYQRGIEKKAALASKTQASGREIPALTLKEFLSGQLEKTPLPKNSCPSGVFRSNIKKFFPPALETHLLRALEEFEKKLKGFVLPEALLFAPETRTSAPVQILREKNSLESLSHQFLYPCGEGAGHAGGITSAAVDGICVAEAIHKKYLEPIPKPRS